MVAPQESKSLADTVAQKDPLLFLEWFDEASKDTEQIKEEVASLPAGSHRSLWKILLEWTQDEISRLSQMTNGNDPESGTRLLSAIVSVMSFYTHPVHKGTIPLPNSLQSCLVLLTARLPQMGNIHKKLGLALFTLCKTWYDLKLEGTEQIQLNMMLYALQAAVDPKAKQNDIKQIWTLHGLVAKLYTTHEEVLKPLLLQCATSFRILENEDGRRFVSRLFTLDATLVPILHEKIKNQILQCKPAEAQFYGDVYFGAWRLTEEDLQKTIENDLLQDLMFHAVHASHKPVDKSTTGGSKSVTLATLLFWLLHSLHRRKESATVTSMLHRLYEPFLWRSLNAPNALVRTNALHIFFDAFPFTCDDGVAANDEYRKKQFETMLKLIVDPVPSVRAAAIEGMFGTMAEFWETFPLDVINRGMKILLKDMLYDATTADVRLAVVKGLSVLAENRLTHNILQKLLPTTRNTLHDVNEKVRVAYVNLLGKTQTMRVLKSWQVVGSDHLFARLGEDSSTEVCVRLVSLLHPQIHPAGKDDAVVLDRCIKLLKVNRLASRRFYQFSSECMDLTQTTHFILVVWKLLKKYAKRVLRRGAKSDLVEDRTQQAGAEQSASGDMDGSSSEEETEENDGGNKENENDEELLTGDVLTGLFDVVYCLIYYNLKKFMAKENRKYLDNVAKRFNKSAAAFLRCFRESECLRPLLLVYSLISNPSRTLVSYVKSRLKSCENGITEMEFSYLLDALCNWGRGDEVTELIEEAVQRKLLASNTSRKSSRQQGSRKFVSFEASESPSVETALRYLSYVLQHPQNKKSLLQRNAGQLQDLCCKMATVTDLIDAFIEKHPDTDIDPDLRSIAISYAKLTGVLMSKSADTEPSPGDQVQAFNAKERFTQLLDWAEKILVPPEANTVVENRNGAKRTRRGNKRLNETVRNQETDKDLLVEIVNIGNSLVSVELADKDLTLRLGSFVRSFVQRHETPCMLSLAMFTAFNLISFAKSKLEYDMSTLVPETQRRAFYSEYHKAASVLIAHVLGAMGRRLNSGQIFPTQEYEDISQALKELLTKLMEGNDYCRHPQDDVFETVAVHIYRSMREAIAKEPDLALPSKVGDLPPAAALAASASCGRSKVFTKLVKELDFLMAGGTVTDLYGLMGLAHVLWAFASTKGKIPKEQLLKCVAQGEKLLSSLPTAAEVDGESRNESFSEMNNFAAVLKDLFLKMKNKLSS